MPVLVSAGPSVRRSRRRRPGLDPETRPGDGNANDIVGSNNGTLMIGATFAAGKAGQAFSLDGTNDFVSVPDSDLWAFGPGDFTIDLWANFKE